MSQDFFDHGKDEVDVVADRLLPSWAGSSLSAIGEQQMAKAAFATGNPTKEHQKQKKG